MRNRIYNSVLCVLVLSVSMWAQRGGMGGGHGVGGGGHAMGGHAGMGAHPSSGSRPVSMGHGGWNNGWHGNGWHGNGWNNGWGWHGNGIRNPYWRTRYAYPYYGYYGYGYGSPYWGWSDFDNGYDNGYSNDAYAPQPDYSQYAMYADVRSPGPLSATYASQDEVQQIQSEVRRLRDQQTRGFASITPPSNEPQTALVFRDGHTENVRNYAIAGNTLWVLDQSHARKVPLGSIDVPATRQQNEDRGVKFETPPAP
jgi:hypothetical protein